MAAEGHSIDWRGPSQRIAADHPSLAGHFPGRPVVPGVVLLDCVRVAVADLQPGWRLAGLPNVKFLSPLLPEQDFYIRLQGEAPRLRFSIERESQVLAQGQLELGT